MPKDSKFPRVLCMRKQKTFRERFFKCWRHKTVSQTPTNSESSNTDLTSTTAWANLPQDILDIVIHRLLLPDRIRLASVCTSWNSIARSNPLFFSAPQPPWLLLVNKLTLKTATFFNLSENKIYKISQPDPPICNRTWCGSSSGWLVTMDVVSGLLLLNPLTGSQIQLPPLTTLPNLARPYRMAKVSWSSSHYTVMLALLSAPYLAFTKEGDEAWTSLEGTRRIADLAVHNERFYTLDLDGTVVAWDLNGPSPLVVSVILPGWLPSKISYGYLVGSSVGLLQVWRARDEMDFVVLELDLISEEWIKVESLGDRALFLDLFCSLCVSSRDLANLRGNCIYFTTGHLEKPRREWGTRRFSFENRSVESTTYNPQSHIWETWVFSLDGRTLEPITHPQSHWKQPPIWITPSWT
ncbi:uncharacterized protein A4U43_C01F25960 [Asparagus officinalis]|uniref:F-box domain-containing protein n=1 Tax=Asparagus officinalis TaxID=4686 RepID=A0A5P1FT22_ASPOF|nr:putative F-box protein At4g17565 [Asparagus officinalis]XP_020251418.1 putative F-box protein At4g17565 [Asparagus officinalis]ONK81164.1 uncharacterized protein A4U43_C01F25960 [Asparagus officinalis]